METDRLLVQNADEIPGIDKGYIVMEHNKVVGAVDAVIYNGDSYRIEKNQPFESVMYEITEVGGSTVLVANELGVGEDYWE